MKNYHRLAFLVSFLLFSLVGCGSNVTTVGTVTFPDGTPLTEGQILFQNDQHEFLSLIGANGTYSMWGVRQGDGVPPGTYSVFFRFPNYVYLDEIPIDPKFVGAESSGLTAEVVRGRRNRFDFTVTENLLEPGSMPRFTPSTPPRER